MTKPYYIVVDWTGLKSKAILAHDAELIHDSYDGGDVYHITEEQALMLRLENYSVYNKNTLSDAAQKMLGIYSDLC